MESMGVDRSVDGIRKNDHKRREPGFDQDQREKEEKRLESNYDKEGTLRQITVSVT